MIDPKSFYSSFQVNYFDYKLEYQLYALNNIESFCLGKKILGYSDEDFKRAIKSDIRQTLFQAIETVFDIVFALTKTHEGKYLDTEILRILSIPTYPYDRIKKISENKDELKFLDSEVCLGSISITLGEYIFFFGTRGIQELKNKLKDNLEAIKNILHILAKEFSDRREYNCYKHGLRLIPALSEFMIQRADTNENIVKWDLTDSMTFYSEDQKCREMEFTTKVFDTDRDVKLTQLTSCLLWNIIKLRDLAFNKKDKSEVMGLNVILFNNETVNNANKINVSLQNLKFRSSY